MADPLHEAEDYQAATIRNFFGSEGYVDDVNTPVWQNASTILAPKTSSAVESVLALFRLLPVSVIKTK